MPSKTWKPTRYKTTADLLRKLGFNITYKANDRKTFRQRGIIRRLYEQNKGYINYAELNTFGKQRTIGKIEYNFKFQKLTPKQRKFAIESGLFSKEQFVGKGLFVEKPAAMPARQYKVRFSKGGKVTIEGGSRRDVIVRVDSKELIIDPANAWRKAIAKYKAQSVSLMVNGFRAKNVLAFDIKQFYYYMKNELFPEWIERNEQYYDSQEEAAEKFADIFHARVLYKKLKK